MTNGKIPMIAAGVLVLVLTGFAYFQGNTINDQRDALAVRTSTIKTLERDLDSEMADNDRLIEEKAVLEARIAELEAEMARQQQKIDRLNGRVQELNGKIRRRNNKIDQLRAEIASLSRRGNEARGQIAQLEVEKAKLKKQLDQYRLERETTVEVIDVLKDENADKQEELNSTAAIAAIVGQTEITWQRIKARKRELRGNLRKIGNREKDWNYTVIDFFLDNPNPEILLDQEFLLLIRDQETGEVLSYNQPNPEFPQSDADTKGVQFTFDGNRVELVYYNSEVKTSKNYEIEVYLLKDGDAMLLNDGKKEVIHNGRVLEVGE